jgi:hypothetical protein
MEIPFFIGRILHDREGVKPMLCTAPTMRSRYGSQRKFDCREVGRIWLNGG